MVIGPALTLPALARGSEEAERTGVELTPEPVNKANFTQRLTQGLLRRCGLQRAAEFRLRAQVEPLPFSHPKRG